MRKALQFEMASCEKGRTSAYSTDLCWRIVWQSQTLLQSSTTVAKHLGVDVSTVRRIVHRFHTTGGVEKIAYPASCTFSDYQRGSVCLNHPELVHKQPAHLVSPGVAHYSKREN